MLADLDYLESRTTEKNTNSMLSFENPYEACKKEHAIAVLTEWDEFVQYDWQRIYDSMQKPAFVLMEEIY
jgi:UDPglucose 6-dehydrogenase